MTIKVAHKEDNHESRVAAIKCIKISTTSLSK